LSRGSSISRHITAIAYLQEFDHKNSTKQEAITRSIAGSKEKS